MSGAPLAARPGRTGQPPAGTARLPLPASATGLARRSWTSCGRSAGRRASAGNY